MSNVDSNRLNRVVSPRQRERIAKFAYQIRINPKALISITILFVFVMVTIFAPYIAPQSPTATDVMERTKAPSVEHPFGTDNFGRDILSRVIMGSRISLYVGSVSVGISTALGVLIGLVSGYYGGWVDEVLMRLADAMMSFPSILLALVVMAILGPNLTNVLFALAFVYTPYMARVARSATLSTINEEYIKSAKARGERDTYIMFREVLPNTMAPILVQGSINFAFAILAEAGLSFLGMGTQPPTPSWGLMINSGRGYLIDAPWMSIFPGLAIGITVLGLNMFGDAIRDIIDPKVDTAQRQ